MMPNEFRFRRQTEQIAVVDDLLAPEAFAAVFSLINEQKFELVHNRQWQKAWRLQDGLPLHGPPVLYFADPDLDDPGAKSYPTGTAIDYFIDRLRAVVAKCGDLVGAESADWNVFSVTPWIYPPGSTLSLHCDGGGQAMYSGAFTYFLHPRWNIHWGGHLLVLDPETEVSGVRGAQWLIDDAENAQVWEPGLGTAVLPKPNRLALLAPDAWHMLTRVDPTAGLHARISLAGFFQCAGRA